MDAFGIHRSLVEDYSSYNRSFVDLKDDRVRDVVDKAIADGLLWPDPWLQLNPAFEPGASPDEMVDEGLLHPECGRIFRIKQHREDHGTAMRFHRHQDQAIRTARQGKNYVLTTGTGSGKSLSYIVPIVDHVLRQREKNPAPGVKAIIVYPMNALANSQDGELEKFIKYGYPVGAEPLRYARYTGQENDEQREAILANPPDIVLTNYVMLELILTRRTERQRLVRAARGSLQYLVLDELHTYRGRQGADVAMLVRRVRDACDAQDLQVVGTSATMASGGSEAENTTTVAAVASRLFGADVAPADIVGETLARTTPEIDLADSAVVERLRGRIASTPPDDLDAFRDDAMSSWIETAFGLTRSPESDKLVRRDPRRIGGDDGAAAELAELTGHDTDACAAAIERQLMASYAVVKPPARPPFAFRLHQFLTKGDTVYASAEAPANRYLTAERTRFAPGDRGRPLLPLAFCRECGQDVYPLWRTAAGTLTARDLGERSGSVDDAGETDAAGFLMIRDDWQWPNGGHLDHHVIQRVPDSWLQDHNGVMRIDPNRRADLPVPVTVSPEGVIGDEGTPATWIPAPFRFCLNCGVSYDASQRSDISKLSGLSSGGRSTATTVLALSLISNLREAEDLPAKARKLLSFSDNRQDAALQAGHFNDFVEVSLIRGALHRALVGRGDDGLTSDELTKAVFDALALPLDAYAADPTVKFGARDAVDKAFRDMLGYRLLLDLRRGWRVTMPNLEQTGLLELSYDYLDDLCADELEWSGTHAALVSASPNTRQRLCQVLADDLRRNLCVHATYLDPEDLEQIRNRAYGLLQPRWAFEPDERPEVGVMAWPRSRGKRDDRNNHYISGRGGFAKWLRKTPTLPEWDGDLLKPADAEEMIRDLLDRMRVAGVTRVVAEEESAEGETLGAYQLVASAMRWHAADGSSAASDVLRTPDLPEGGGRANPYFVEFYRTVGASLAGLEAREHTAQVRVEDRMAREDAFREATLPVLFCSPTMELGVDIAQLNAVHLRNVPPTPANYAQRSGRAGRSGQPAIVTTYCATGSPHDSYFFRNSDAMVAGAVAPPRLELANADLVRTHVHAIWLAEAGVPLGRSMQEMLRLDEPGLPLNEDLTSASNDDSILSRTAKAGRSLLASVTDDLADAPWYDDRWLDRTVKQIPDALDRSCSRWRELYLAAMTQAAEQSRISQDPNVAQKAKRRARMLRGEAEAQVDLLLNDSTREHSDFYPYRYLAAEGFLPGYSFPRLPLSAFIPARRKRDEYLQRPRFLAITEFGPGALVYHEGSRYQITKVVIPVSEIGEDGTLPLGSVKQCETCGYLHPYEGLAGADVCDRCKEPLGAPLTGLFRMHNVITRRRERINSDEEERQRRGYDLRTGVRFTSHGDRPGSLAATTLDGMGMSLLDLTYGDAATIWRINLGWRRRKNPNVHGYALDLEDGRWLAEKDLAEAGDADTLPSMTSETRVQRVIPYVEDTRNCLVIESNRSLDTTQMASLSAALKIGIQRVFQLEDNELAAEPLPTPDDRRAILIYEAAEGGAGVLRRLLKEPGALSEVGKAALQTIHVEPDGSDITPGPGEASPCEAACYDCLLSYGNQRDHDHLDRRAIVGLLRDIAAGTVGPAIESTKPSPPLIEKARRAPAPTDHQGPAHTVVPDTRIAVGEVPTIARERTVTGDWGTLARQSDSELEKQWLDVLRDLGGRPPTAAQQLLEFANTRPDFLYTGDYTAVYIDGPHHDKPEQQRADKEIDALLADAGYDVLRFRWDQVDAWPDKLRTRPGVFGVKGANE